MTKKSAPACAANAETGARKRAATNTPNFSQQSTAAWRQNRVVIDAPFPLVWAEALIAKAEGQPVPRYGSREWSLLPDTSPLKVAGCVLAAERERTRHKDYGHAPEGRTASRRAREIAEARRPRPGDHPGGSVPVWPAEVTSNG